MSNGSISLSVVIPTQGPPRRLLRLLRNLDDQYLEPQLYEVLVLDDSPEGSETRGLVRELDVRYRVHLLRSRRPGIMAARNHGAEESEGDHILFLSEAVMAPPGLLEAHFLAHKAHPHRVIRGPILPLEGERFPLLDAPPPSARAGFTTNNASVSKVVLYKMGGFEQTEDPDLEDREVGWRLQTLGWGEQFTRAAYAYEEGQPQAPPWSPLQVQAELLARSAVSHYARNPSRAVARATGIEALKRKAMNMLAGQPYRAACRQLHQGALGRTGWSRALLEQQVHLSCYYEALTRELARQGLA